MEISEQGTSRRQALRDLGLGLGVLTVGTATLTLDSLLPAAAASKPVTTTTTAAKEEGLSEADLLAFLESVELAAAATYDTALGGTLVGANAATLSQVRDHHRQHAQAVAGLAGAAAEGKANPKLVQVTHDQLGQAHTSEALIKVLGDLEGALAATHLLALGRVVTPAHQSTLASILPVESQHALVLGQIQGRPLTDLVPNFEIVDRAVPPETFPLKETAK